MASGADPVPSVSVPLQWQERESARISQMVFLCLLSAPLVVADMDQAGMDVMTGYWLFFADTAIQMKKGDGQSEKIC